MTVETTSSLPTALFLSELTAYDAAWFLGARTWQRANAAQTGGSLGLVEHILNPGFESPYHTHHNEDEAFHVLDGEIRFFSEGRSWVAGADGFAFPPLDHQTWSSSCGPPRTIPSISSGDCPGKAESMSASIHPNCVVDAKCRRTR